MIKVFKAAPLFFKPSCGLRMARVFEPSMPLIKIEAEMSGSSAGSTSRRNWPVRNSQRGGLACHSYVFAGSLPLPDRTASSLGEDFQYKRLAGGTSRRGYGLDFEKKDANRVGPL
ncbi:MAG TPA: hypothetical protein VGC09_03205 [Rhodopila sp.]